MGTAQPAAGEDGRVLCTPEYAAPELLVGTVTAQADIYALGHIMMELLDGRAPYDFGDNPLKAISNHLQDTPVPLGTYAEASGLAPILRKAVAKPPSERFPGADAMLKALHQTASHLPRGPYLRLSELRVRDSANAGQCPVPGSVTHTQHPTFDATLSQPPYAHAGGVRRDGQSAQDALVSEPSFPLPIRYTLMLAGLGALLATGLIAVAVVEIVSGSQQGLDPAASAPAPEPRSQEPASTGSADEAPPPTFPAPVSLPATVPVALPAWIEASSDAGAGAGLTPVQPRTGGGGGRGLPKVLPVREAQEILQNPQFLRRLVVP
jgi:serine/threonine protein kinase